MTSKTVQKDLSHLRSQLNQKHNYLQAKRGQGFHLADEYQLAASSLELSRNKDVILNNYDRLAYLIQRLLLQPHYLRYEDLAQEIFVSYSTLSRCMKKVQVLLQQYQLQLVQKPNRGTCVVGSEIQFRCAIAAYFYQNFLSSLSNYQQDIYDAHSALLEPIRQIITTQSLKSKVHFSDPMVADLAIHVLIAAQRLDLEEDLEYPTNWISDPQLEALALNILSASQALFPGKLFTPQTVNYLAYHLDLKQILDTKVTDLTGKVDATLDHILAEIADNFGIDFTAQRRLLSFLQRHLYQLQRRVQRQLSVQNLRTLVYFRKYLFAAKMVISVAPIISRELLDYPLPASEYGALILYFQSGLEELRLQHKQIIGLYAENDCAKELLFQAKIARITPPALDFQILHSLTTEIPPEITTIISTRALKRPVALKRLIVLDDLEELNSQKLLHQIQTIADPQQVLKKYLRPESFLQLTAQTKDEVQLEIGRYLCQQGFFKENLAAPLEYEEIGNGLVHIQDLNRIIKVNLCLIVSLTKPILWDDTVIKLLFLIKTKRDGDQDLEFLCQTFSQFANSIPRIEQAYHAKNSDELLQALN
ncbi:helix-turn-helix domain-containing protein [Lactobacillus sp. DCY120]|uniref:Helix-turn-helix domain-containing protein n=1 Tax=Bombilactobacillus apium TaxID=2675299 RepID=A0A850R6V8_9LACO|nr:helix-turn-helix domain-containing protein [Bombilactobacillus apium]NVY96382.1 helix-turn-helix domain-containing protein [Bombilactobacillus apium]